MTERTKCLLCGVILVDRKQGTDIAQAHQDCLVGLLHGPLKQKLELLHQDRINKTRIFYNKQEIFAQSFELKMTAQELPMMHIVIPVVDMHVERDGEYSNIIIVDKYTDEDVT